MVERPSFPTRSAALVASALLLLPAAASAATAGITVTGGGTSAQRLTFSCGNVVGTGVLGRSDCTSAPQFIPAGTYTLGSSGSGGLGGVGSIRGSLGGPASMHCTVAPAFATCGVDGGSGTEGTYTFQATFTYDACVLSCAWSASITLTPE